MENDRQALIAQMMEITNCDESVALNYLTRTNYDVEIAIRHFFEGTLPEPINNQQTPSISPHSSSRASSLPNISDLSTDPVSTPSQTVLPRYHSLIQFLAQFFTLPVRLPLIIINFVYDFFFGAQQVVYPHIFEYITKEWPEFESSMSDVFYSQRIQHLRTDITTHNWKWLVAYIHDPNGSPDYFKKLFSSNLPEHVKESGGVFFGCVMGSDDAQRLRPDRTFGRNRKSCVLVFMIRGTSLTRKLMIDDLSNPDVVNVNLYMALNDLIVEEADREAKEKERNETRQLMEEQNREYQESLQRDLERIAKSKLEKEAAEKALQEEQKKQEESEKRVKRVEDFKKELIEQDKVTEGPHDLLIRFPSGKKVIKFDADDKLEKLFDEALKSELCPLFFQMHQSFPKKAVSCLPKWYFDILELEELEPKEECLSRDLTFREAEITHGALVYIDNL